MEARATKGTVLRIVTVTAWVTLVVAATPWGDFLVFDIGRVALAVALAGTATILVDRHAVSVHEIYEAGKVAGRREADAPRPRHLRVVQAPDLGPHDA